MGEARAVLCGVLGALLVAEAACAQDLRLPPPLGATSPGIKLGEGVILKPFARHTTWYTTNMFQERHRDAHEDVVFATIGGVDLLLEGDAGSLELGYAATGLLHARLGRLDTVEHLLRWQGSAERGALKLGTNGLARWGVTNTDPQLYGRVRNFQGLWGAYADWQASELVGARVDGGLELLEAYPRRLRAGNAFSWRLGTWLTLTPNTPLNLVLEAGAEVREIHYVKRRAPSPDLGLVNGALGARAESKLLDARVRVGYERGWRKGDSGAPRRPVSDGLIAKWEVGWRPLASLRLGAFGLHELRASYSAAYQRNTQVGLRASQELPRQVELFGEASYEVQEHRHAPDLRAQLYLVGVEWEPMERLAVAGQATYARTGARRSARTLPYDRETFTAALSLTVRY